MSASQIARITGMSHWCPMLAGDTSQSEPSRCILVEWISARVDRRRIRNISGDISAVHIEFQSILGKRNLSFKMLLCPWGAELHALMSFGLC
jgi:hypothetical protein